MKKKHMPGVIYLCLAVFLAISWYQTGKGFTGLLGPVLAWGFSTAVTLLMFWIAHMIGTKRMNGQPVLSLVLFFLVCSLFSYAGNFNAVYTTYQTEQLYRDELNLHRNELNQLLSSATKVLNNYAPEVQEKKVRVAQLTNQLVKQITDSANPGLGVRAREIVKEIEGILGEKLTEFSGKPEELAQKYEDNITDLATKKFTAGDLGRVNDVLSEVKTKAAHMDEEISDVLSSSENVKSKGYATNLHAVDTINSIGATVQEFVNDPKRFTFNKSTFESQEIGKIAFSFQSGWIRHTLVGALFTLFCLFFDWAVVLFILLAYRRHDEDPYEPAPVRGVDL